MSTFNVNRQFSAMLNVNGADIPLAYGGIKEISIVENTKTMIPQFKIVVNDYTNHLYNAAPHDGCKVQLQFDDGSSQKASELFKLSLFGGPTTVDIGAAMQFSMVGTLDASTYMLQHVTKSYSGTSNEALAKVAQECGLKPIDLASCQDKQVWLPHPVSFAKYVQRITDHGYAGSSSIMASAVTASHGFLYKDLDKEMQKSGIATFYNGHKPPSGRAIRIAFFPEISSTGGVLNRMFGYGVKMQQEKLDGSANTLKSFMAPIMNGSLGMDADIAKSVNTVFQAYVPPDIGNTHEKFMEAKYQNLRGSATFTGTMTVLTDEITGLNLYDPVETYITLPTTLEVSELYSQKFLVSAKTRYMKGSQYVEKLVLINQGNGSVK